MKLNTPHNLKESLIMALPNCCVMAMGMMTVNLWVYDTLILEKWIVTLPFRFFYCW